MRTRGSIYRFLVLLLTVVVLVNLVGQKLGFRWDLTDDDRYTLGNATQRILDDLPTAVTVTAYFTEDLPPDLERTKSAFHDLLVEYNQRSDGRVNFEFVDPSGDEALENEAVREATAKLERELIVRALDQTDWNVTHAAKVLKISRKSLQTKMKELGLRERA